MLDRIMAAGALLAATGTVAARFAPQVDRPYRFTTTETRIDGDVRYRFTVERRVTFHRETGGWSATVVIDHASADAPPALAKAYQAGQSALAAHPIRYRLKADGTVDGIDDKAALWAAVTLAAAGGNAMLPAPDPARRHAMLASTIEVLVAGTDAARQPGPPHPVRIATRPVAGTAADLAGSEQVSRTAAGDLFMLTNASGDIEPGSHVTLTLSRRIDPTTGLVTEQNRVTDTTRDGRTTRTETYMRFALVS